MYFYGNKIEKKNNISNTESFKKKSIAISGIFQHFSSKLLKLVLFRCFISASTKPQLTIFYPHLFFLSFGRKQFQVSV